MHNYIILLHVLAATIWTGWHLVLSTSILPNALKNKDIAALTSFESRYEKVGIPALITLIITGLYLAYSFLPDMSQWFTFQNHLARHVTIKLILLITTFLLAAHARFRLIPNLTLKTFPILAIHIVLVTIISVLFVMTGLNFRLFFF